MTFTLTIISVCSVRLHQLTFRPQHAVGEGELHTSIYLQIEKKELLSPCLQSFVLCFEEKVQIVSTEYGLAGGEFPVTKSLF